MLFIAAIIFIIITILLSSLMSKKGRRAFRTRGRTLSNQECTQVQEQWQEILKLVEITGTSTSNQSVIRADKLLDSILTKMGFSGKSLGDKLKAARERFSCYNMYDTAWKAHKVRNAVVHQNNFDLTKKTAKSTLSQFEEVFKDLGAL